jgi:hypothetical protein
MLLLLGFWSFSAFQETNILEHWTDFCATRSPRACASGNTAPTIGERLPQ